MVVTAAAAAAASTAAEAAVHSDSWAVAEAGWQPVAQACGQGW